MYLPFFCLVLFSCGKGGDGNNTQPQKDPQISISDAYLFEGNSGTTSFPFTVTLDHASSKIVTVYYSTAEGSAGSGDYTSVSNQLLTFQPNETSKTININVTADDIEEADEQFSVVLSGPANASLAKSTAVATIRNDDTKAAFNNTGFDAPTSYPGYSLVWSDEFNGTSLDASAWTFETGNNGWGNNELENYTDRKQNSFVSNGNLIIEARSESYNGVQYTSARMITKNKKFLTSKKE